MAKIDKTYHGVLEKILSKGKRRKDPNRKGVYRIQIPSYTIEHDFENGFPAITTKKLYWKGIVGELLWFLRGDTNIKYLVDNGINIWNKDAYNWLEKTYPQSEGEFPSYEELFKNPDKWDLDLGRIYGAQWRNFAGYRPKEYTDIAVDQISNLIKGLKENPLSSQHIVTAWNPAELDDMALPPCHWSFEILVEPTVATQKGESYKFVMLNFDSDKENEVLFEYPKYQFTLKWHQRSVDTFLGKM